TSEGDLHSKCTCTSPNDSFVSIPPDLGTTVTIPPSTFQGAAPAFPALFHCSRLFPSKSTMASEGGKWLASPGVTTLGSGSQNSVASGGSLISFCWENTGKFTAASNSNTANSLIFIIKGISVIIKF